MKDIDPENRQLDAISRAIGKFEAYASEFREGSIAITKLIESNEKLSCHRDEELKQEVGARFDRELTNIHTQLNGLSDRITEVGKRVTIFENDRTRREGAIGVGNWFLKNWPTAGVLAALTGVVAWANDKLF